MIESPTHATHKGTIVADSYAPRGLGQTPHSTPNLIVNIERRLTIMSTEDKSVSPNNPVGATPAEVDAAEEYCAWRHRYDDAEHGTKTLIVAQALGTIGRLCHERSGFVVTCQVEIDPFKETTRSGLLKAMREVSIAAQDSLMNELGPQVRLFCTWIQHPLRLPDNPLTNLTHPPMLEEEDGRSFDLPSCTVNLPGIEGPIDVQLQPATLPAPWLFRYRTQNRGKWITRPLFALASHGSFARSVMPTMTHQLPKGGYSDAWSFAGMPLGSHVPPPLYIGTTVYRWPDKDEWPGVNYGNGFVIRDTRKDGTIPPHAIEEWDRAKLSELEPLVERTKGQLRKALGAFSPRLLLDIEDELLRDARSKLINEHIDRHIRVFHPRGETIRHVLIENNGAAAVTGVLTTLQVQRTERAITTVANEPEITFETIRRGVEALRRNNVPPDADGNYHMYVPTPAPTDLVTFRPAERPRRPVRPRPPAARPRRPRNPGSGA